MKEGLEAGHVKRHQEEMRNMRSGMEANKEKRMMEAVAWARAEILNNGSTGGTNGGTNGVVPDLSMPSPMSESFDEKKTRMTGIE